MCRIVSRGLDVAVALGAVVLLGSGVVAAQQAEVSASKGWVKLPAAGETHAAAFVVVNNPTMYDVYVLSVTTDVAEKVEIRQATDEVVKELTIPAYGSLAMDPAGVHLLLTGLTRPLQEDEQIPLMLKTDGGISVTVSAVVRKE